MIPVLHMKKLKFAADSPRGTHTCVQGWDPIVGVPVVIQSPVPLLLQGVRCGPGSLLSPCHVSGIKAEGEIIRGENACGVGKGLINQALKGAKFSSTC